MTKCLKCVNYTKCIMGELICGIMKSELNSSEIFDEYSPECLTIDQLQHIIWYNQYPKALIQADLEFKRRGYRP